MKHFKIVLTDAMEMVPGDKILHLIAGVKRKYLLKGVGVVDIEFEHSGKPDGANILFDCKEIEL
jgi:hypothetical protein